jgi:hypothetical protein
MIEAFKMSIFRREKNCHTHNDGVEDDISVAFKDSIQLLAAPSEVMCVIY